VATAPIQCNGSTTWKRTPRQQTAILIRRQTAHPLAPARLLRAAATDKTARISASARKPVQVPTQTLRSQLIIPRAFISCVKGVRRVATHIDSLVCRQAACDQCSTLAKILVPPKRFRDSTVGWRSSVATAVLFSRRARATLLSPAFLIKYPHSAALNILTWRVQAFAKREVSRLALAVIAIDDGLKQDTARAKAEDPDHKQRQPFVQF